MAPPLSGPNKKENEKTRQTTPVYVAYLLDYDHFLRNRPTKA